MSGRAWSVALAAIVLGYLVHVAWLAGVAEDAFISFRFARHLAEGQGLAWNPGAAPVEGYTNFLWVLLEAAFVWMDWDVPRTTQLVGTLAGLATLVYVALAARSTLDWERSWSLLPSGLLALAGPFATWAAAGLETVFFAALVMAALFHAASWVREARGVDRVLFVAALLLAALTRPEGVLVAGVLLPLAFLEGPAQGRGSLAATAGVGLLLFGAYFFWRWSYFGYPLPNTYYAKTGGGLAQVLRGAQYAGWFAWHFVTPWLPALLLGRWCARVWPGIGPAAAGGAAPLLVMAGVLSVVWVVAVVALGGDYMAMYRFFVPILPPLALLLAHALRGLLRDSVTSPRPLRAAAIASVACGALGTLLHSTPLEARIFDVPPRLHGNWRGVETERWHVARLTRIAELFARLAPDASASVATDAIGAIGWFSKLRVYGAHGLVDPEIAHESAAEQDLGRDYAGHDRRDLWRLFAQDPTFFMFTRELRETRPSRIEVPDEYAAVVADRYMLRSVWLEDPVNGEAGWFSFLERRPAPRRRTDGTGP